MTDKFKREVKLKLQTKPNIEVIALEAIEWWNNQARTAVKVDVDGAYYKVSPQKPDFIRQAEDYFRFNNEGDLAE